MIGIRVMLVEDHTLVREGLRNLLLLEDDIDIVAESGDAREALENIQKAVPDIVLMDIALPGMDGIEVTAKIKKEFPDVCIIMLTMHVDEHLIIRSVEAGASAYLLKSTTREQLIDTIRIVINGQHQIILSSAQVKALLNMKNKTSSTIQEITFREKEILRCLCEGLTNKEIGVRLYITESTVKSHLYNIYVKLGVSYRTEAVAKAKERGYF